MLNWFPPTIWWRCVEGLWPGWTTGSSRWIVRLSPRVWLAWSWGSKLESCEQFIIDFWSRSKVLQRQLDLRWASKAKASLDASYKCSNDRDRKWLHLSNKFVLVVVKMYAISETSECLRRAEIINLRWKHVTSLNIYSHPTELRDRTLGHCKLSILSGLDKEVMWYVRRLLATQFVSTMTWRIAGDIRLN